MRKPIIHASFHPSVSQWSLEEFKERFKDQMSEDDILYHAKNLGLVSEPVVVNAPATSENINVPIPPEKPTKGGRK